jgi:branched-chain amino acid transport system permease protein
MTGMLYSLVALGFVLIFKASGVFNFAQGAMVLFAALAMARFAEWIPQAGWADSKLLATCWPSSRRHGGDGRVAWVIERWCWASWSTRRHHAADGHAGHHLLPRRLRPDLFGSDIYKIDIGLPKDPMFLLENVFQGGVLVNKEDLYAAGIAAALVAALALFFQYTGTGRALRAVADDHQAAQSHRHPAQPHLGHRLERGRLRGAGGRHHLGQQAGRAVLAVAGGAEGAAGGDPGRPDQRARRHHRRADHRRGREAVRGLHRPLLGGGIEIWFAYVLALFPAGAAAGAVRREDHRSRLNPHVSSLQAGAARRCSTEKRPVQDQLPRRPADLPDPQDRIASALLVAFAFVAVPLLASEYLFRAILIPFLILSLAALGLNILVGYCGQISLGTGAFMAVGAYAAYNFQVRIDGMPLLAGHAAGRRVRHGGGRAVRHPVAAHQGPVPGGGHAGGAVLLRLGLPAHQVVHQRLVLGLGQRGGG